MLLKSNELTQGKLSRTVSGSAVLCSISYYYLLFLVLLLFLITVGKITKVAHTWAVFSIVPGV